MSDWSPPSDRRPWWMPKPVWRLTRLRQFEVTATGIKTWALFAGSIWAAEAFTPGPMTTPDPLPEMVRRLAALRKWYEQ